MLIKEEWKLKGDFLSEFCCHLLSISFVVVCRKPESLTNELARCTILMAHFLRVKTASNRSGPPHSAQPPSKVVKQDQNKEKSRSVFRPGKCPVVFKIVISQTIR